MSTSFLLIMVCAIGYDFVSPFTAQEAVYVQSAVVEYNYLNADGYLEDAPVSSKSESVNYQRMIPWCAKYEVGGVYASRDNTIVCADTITGYAYGNVTRAYVSSNRDGVSPASLGFMVNVQIGTYDPQTNLTPIAITCQYIGGIALDYTRYNRTWNDVVREPNFSQCRIFVWME